MTRAPRVLLSGVVLGQPVGGVRRHAAELLPRAARLLAEGGGALHVLEGARPIAFSLPASIERLASRVPYQPAWRRSLAEGPALRRALASARRAGRPFDLVHSAHLPVPRLGDAPLALTLHDLRALDPRLSGPLRRRVAGRLLRAAVARATLLITVSETVRRELLARYGARRVHVVPNAADHLPRLPDGRFPTGVERRGGPLLHVGHLEPRKNLGLLIEALAKDPSLPDLQLAGRAKGDEERRLRALAHRLDVSARVHFLGEVPDASLPELYARAACAVFPSRLEGFGIGALEAQWCGVPLAVARAAVHDEVLGEEVVQFAEHDAGEAARAIRTALAIDDVRLRRGVQRAARFGWDQSAERLVAAWRAAADPAGAPE